MADWKPIDSGSTVGTTGSEAGVIIRDDEHRLGARITLERGGCVAPFAVTCGIYGAMVHTAWASSEPEAMALYEAMKERLSLLVSMPDNDLDAFYSEVRRFVNDF